MKIYFKILIWKGTLNESGSSVQDVLYNVRLTTYDSNYCSTVEVSLTKDWNRQLCAGEYSGGDTTLNKIVYSHKYIFFII